jgi:hypothetical protein
LKGRKEGIVFVHAYVVSRRLGESDGLHRPTSDKREATAQERRQC